MKSIEEINQKIRNGDAVVVRADEMPDLYEEDPEKAVEEVDVVATGTFGVMCSSGAFFNFGHADPPIKMNRVWLNDVEAYSGLAAIDAYIGATQLSKYRDFDYGGAHVIEDLIDGKDVELRADAYGTDCYPRKKVETNVSINDLNEAFLFNPRNAYQSYKAATNSSDALLRTYMGTLLPDMANVNFAGTGELNPLVNDPNYDIIGTGTKIMLGGAEGFVVRSGTQHSPDVSAGNLATTADLRDMNTDYVKAANIPGYGVSLFLGIGVAIPVLNEEIAKNTAIRNKDVKTVVVDYGTPRRARPRIKEVDYKELFSGEVDLGQRIARTSSLSSMRITNEIVDELKEKIESGKFLLTEKQDTLPREGKMQPMRMQRGTKFVKNVMTKDLVTAKPETNIRDLSTLLVENNIDQVPVVKNNKLVGIVTSRDITEALAEGMKDLQKAMTKKVITADANEAIEVVGRRLDKYGIDAAPVVDIDNNVIGIITIADIMRRGRAR